MKRLLLGKLADESERRSNIISSQIVLALNLFKGHAAGEAPDHDRHRNTRATNDGFPVADSRIDNNAVLSLHGDSNSTGFTQLVEISVSFGELDIRVLFARAPVIPREIEELHPRTCYIDSGWTPIHRACSQCSKTT